MDGMKPMVCCECGQEVDLQSTDPDREKAKAQLEAIMYYHNNVKEIRPPCNDCCEKFPFKYPVIDNN